MQLLLEEAYRSNAGLTCPKFVMWDAPDRLASVGMGADRLGVVHQLVEPGELDPNAIHTPGAYVRHVLELTPAEAVEKRIEKVTVRGVPS